jgi:hypothetical protein
MPPPTDDDAPQQSKDLSLPCRLCGFLMFLAVVEPSEKLGYEKRLYQCAGCRHSETVHFKYE